MVLIGTIAALFGIQIALSRPELAPIFYHLFVPSKQIFSDPMMLYISIGILGATVMPHNLYLHSSIVQTRSYPRTTEGKREAIRWASLDSAIALMMALLVNAAILIVAAAVFHKQGHYEVAEIGDAYKLLTPLLGFTGASTMFALACSPPGRTRPSPAPSPARSSWKASSKSGCPDGCAASSPACSPSSQRSSSPRFMAAAAPPNCSCSARSSSACS